MHSYGVLISPQDAPRVMDRFGVLPESPAIPILAPPPQTVDAIATAAELDAHATWLRQWKTLRHSGLGASEVPTVVGCQGAYGSPFALWWQKCQGLDFEHESFGDEEVMAMGTRLESVIGQVWQERNPDALLVRPGAGLYRDANLPWRMATPDFLAVSSGRCSTPDHCAEHGDCVGPVVEPVECKAYDGGKGWGVPGTDQVPEHIGCQLLMQCEVLGAMRGHVVRMRGKKVTSYTIERYPQGDEGFRRARLEFWEKQCERFVQSLSTGEPPPLDGSEATERVLAIQFSDIIEGDEAQVPGDLADRYREALLKVAHAQAYLGKQKNLLRAAMRTAEFAVDPVGQRVAQRRSYKRMAYTVPAKVIDGLWPAGPRS